MEKVILVKIMLLFEITFLSSKDKTTQGTTPRGYE